MKKRFRFRVVAINYINASYVQKTPAVYDASLEPVRVPDVLRHRMHTRIIRVAGCVTLPSTVPDSCTYVRGYARTRLRSVRAARRVARITSTFAIIILGKCWSAEQRKNMRSNRRTRGARGLNDIGLYTRAFLSLTLLGDSGSTFGGWNVFRYNRVRRRERWLLNLTSSSSSSSALASRLAKPVQQFWKCETIQAHLFEILHTFIIFLTPSIARFLIVLVIFTNVHPVHIKIYFNLHLIISQHCFYIFNLYLIVTRQRKVIQVAGNNIDIVRRVRRPTDQ